MDNEIRNAADPEKVTEAKKKKLSERDVQLSDLRAVLSTPQGSRLLFRLVGVCGPFDSPAYPGHPDLQNQAIGRGDIGRFLMTEIEAAGVEYLLKFLQENKKGKGK